MTDETSLPRRRQTAAAAALSAKIWEDAGDIYLWRGGRESETRTDPEVPTPEDIGLNVWGVPMRVLPLRQPGPCWCGATGAIWLRTGFNRHRLCGPHWREFWARHLP